MITPDALPRGIVTPLVTFLDADGEPDAAAMAALVESQLAAGIHGLLAVGSTGELGTLTPARRARTIEIVADAVDGRVPVWAGVVGHGTDDAVLAAREAENAGAGALLVLPPMFFDSSDTELERHFTLVADAVDVPVVAYDVPPRTPRKLPAGVIANLARSGVLAGVKDSSGDLTAGRLMVDAVAGIDGFRSYIGSEITIDAAFVLGFDGIVPGFANVLPRPAVELFEAAVDGRVDAEAQRRYLELFEVLRVPLAGGGGPATAINALKTGAAHMLGLALPPVAEPFTQPDAVFAERIAAIVDVAAGR
ncbi:dihydrodipicolinate synthase family protein [Agromyces silvae]|uniref:dihydrodipicolinate synthase family protein n=1 Tax=Agromyces silvae TaxID=3388266 RepID=UPI00280AED80|nr:dihydrodipicolinate synthase family protein [Agromyces protaetiae]